MKNVVVIIDYGMGNVGSVKNALAFLGYEALLSSSPADLERATHLILPGVGAFADGMKNLTKSGLLPALESEVLTRQKPILGLCLGMQLFASEGEEDGLHNGLGWIKGRVRRFSVDERRYKVPHVGWNDVYPVRTPLTPVGGDHSNKLMGVDAPISRSRSTRSNGVYPKDRATIFLGVKRPIFYFVHSYHLIPEDKSIISAEAEYGERFVAAIEKDNIFGLQFHPEKSQQEGLRVLENFLKP